MALGNSSAITVPVRIQAELDNLKDIKEQFQSFLGNIKPDSGAFKELKRLLDGVDKSILKAQDQLTKGFGNTKELEKYGKSVEEIGSVLLRINDLTQNVDFKDWKLDQSQIDQMKALSDAVKAAKDNLATLETDKLKEIAQQSKLVRDTFQSLSIDIDDTNANQILDRISARTKEIQSEISTLELEKDRLLAHQQAVQENTKKQPNDFNRLGFLLDKKRREAGNKRPQYFDEFFTADGTKFKNGGKQNFIKWIQEHFSIDENDPVIEKIKKTNAASLDSIRQDILDAAQKGIDHTSEDFNVTKSQVQKLEESIAIKEGNIVQHDRVRDTVKQGLEDPAYKAAHSAATQSVKGATQAEADFSKTLRESTEVVKENINAKEDIQVAEQNTKRDIDATSEAQEQQNRITAQAATIKNVIKHWLGFSQILQLSRRAIHAMITDIRNLDKAMTEIAVVTNMSQKDLWGQIGTYQKIAQQYGVSTTGVYQISQLYYQQGLDTNSVMQMTTETLKMAKIANLDYATATDYMTVAIRGFKMEMSDAQNVVDVYSRIAAVTASDTEELAVAMSKTASSAQAVGSSFESTTAMLALMIQTTREAPENIGTAMKSIISRYGEMTTDPSKLVDSEGEEMSLNKVDKALQSVGITIHNAAGEFRNFDDVIMELAQKWDTLDKNSQRYIATVMAGNRQQSRFLALVSDYDTLKYLSEEAANAEDAALVQTLKTMDSFETKIQNVKNALQGFYGNLGLEEVFKTVLTVITNVINRLNSMPKLFGKVPVAAVALAAELISLIKRMGNKFVDLGVTIGKQIAEGIKQGTKGGLEGKGSTINFAEHIKQALTSPQDAKVALGYLKNDLKNQFGKIKTNAMQYGGTALQAAGTGLKTWALTDDDHNAARRGAKTLAGSGLSIAGGMLSGAAKGAMLGSAVSPVLGTAIGAIAGSLASVAKNLPSIITGFNDIRHARELAYQARKQDIEQTSQELTLQKNQVREINNVIKKYQDLAKHQYDSNEAHQEYIDYVTQISDTYPELITAYDSEGTAVINLSEAYKKLAEERQAAAEIDVEKTQLELEQAEDDQNEVNDAYIMLPQNKRYRYDTDEAKKRELESQGVRDDVVSYESGLYVTIDDNLVKNIQDYLFTDWAKEANPITVDNSFSDIINSDRKQEFIKELQINYPQLTNEQAEKVINEYLNSDGVLDVAGRIKTRDKDYYSGLFNTQIAKELGIDKSGMSRLNSLDEEAIATDTTLQNLANYIFQESNKRVESKEWENAVATARDEIVNNYAILISNAGDEVIRLQAAEFASKDFHIAEILASNENINAEEAVQTIWKFYSNLSEDAQAEFEAWMNNAGQYATAGDYLKGLAEFGLDENNPIYGWYEAYVNQAYAANDMIRAQFRNSVQRSKGLFTGISDAGSAMDFAASFASLGNGQGLEIASDYLPKMQEQWTQYVVNAANSTIARANAVMLNNAYVHASQIQDTDIKNNVSEILSSAELNTKEGLQATIKQLQDYQKTLTPNSSEYKEIGVILNNLVKREQDIFTNVTIAVQNYTEKLSKTAEETEKILKVQGSGTTDFSDMQTELAQVNAKSDKSFTFDEYWEYDNSLKKFVRTKDGIEASLQAQLLKEKEAYTEASESLQAQQTVLPSLLSPGNNISNGNTLFTAADLQTSPPTQFNEMQKEAYAAYVEDFINSGESLDTWYAKKLEELEENSKTLDEAQQALNTYTLNEASQQIDIEGFLSGSVSFDRLNSAFTTYSTLFKEINDIDLNIDVNTILSNIKEGNIDQLTNNLESLGYTPQQTQEVIDASFEAIVGINELINQQIDDDVVVPLTAAQRQLLGFDFNEPVTLKELVQKAGDLELSIDAYIKSGIVSLESINEAFSASAKKQEWASTGANTQIKSLMSGNVTVDSIVSFVNGIGAQIEKEWDISQLDGLEVNKYTGERYISDVDAFLESLNKILKDETYNPEDLRKQLSLSNLNQANQTIVDAQNSILDNVVNNISSLKGTIAGQSINVTYLQQQFGDDTLLDIFGNAYSDGILAIDEATQASMFASLQKLRTEAQEKGMDSAILNQLDSMIEEYITGAVSEVSSFTAGMKLSNETAQVLAAQDNSFKAELSARGEVILTNTTEFIQASYAIYQTAEQALQNSREGLQTLNTSFANLISANNLTKSAGLELLASGTGFDVSALEQFANVYGKRLDELLDSSGNVRAAADAIQRIGINQYRIADWDKLIEQLGITANELSGEYIDAYIAFLESQTEIGEVGKTNLMTSLIGHMERLTYAEIGSIAKTFGMTVDAVIEMLSDNGDGTFNGNALLNTLDFKKSDEFNKAYNERMETIGNSMTSAMVAFVQAPIVGFDYQGKQLRSTTEATAWNKAYNDYINALQGMGISIDLTLAEATNILRNGGLAAVNLATEIAKVTGQELSASDIEALYRGQIATFINAIDTIIATPGALVDATTAYLINQSGGLATEIGQTGQFVVQSAADLYEVYKNLLAQLEATGEATLADLNKVAGMALDNRDSEQNIIDALGDAAGMTYTRFGEILTSAGYRLTEELVNQLESAGIIKGLGGNQMMITDFSAFADLMGWEANSEQYVSAFKTYNDSLIDMNRKAERNIVEEIQALEGAKGGDWINLTQLTSVLGTGLSNMLGHYLESQGAVLDNGILKLSAEANIPAIITSLANYANAHADLLNTDMAELADTLDQVLDSYIEIIQKGIGGTLTNAEALKTTEIAKSLGLDDLSFITTAEGLQLSRDSALELYAALKEVDAVRAQLVFTDLVDSLSKTDAAFKNVSTTTAEIGRIQKQIADISKEIENTTGVGLTQKEQERLGTLSRQKVQLQEQLQLAKEIQAVQSRNPEQFNFMDRALPEGMQSPINYWNSVGSAFTAINEASSSGYMEIQDFYNIVNEMASLVQMSGNTVQWMGQDFDGSAEQAAYLIEQGMNALSNVDGKGVKIDMSQLGADLQIGATDMGKGFDDAVKEMARSQIALLDAEIQLLEGIVALEKLGDIDVDNDGIEALEMFTTDDGTFGAFSDNFENIAENIKAAAEKNPDLKEALNSFKIGQHTLAELFEKPEAWGDIFANEEEAAAFLDKLVSAIESGDFLENLGNADYFAQLIGDLGQDIVLDTGKGASLVISNGKASTIDWESADTQAALKQIGGDPEEAKKELIAILQKKQNSIDLTGDENLVWHVNAGTIKIEKDENGNTIYKSGNKSFTSQDEALGYAALKAIDATNLSTRTITDEQNNEQVIGYEGTVKIGTRIIHVSSDTEGNVKYHSEALNQDFSSLEELQNAEFEHENALIAHYGGTPITKEEYLELKWGVKVDSNGEPVQLDPTMVASVAEGIKQALTEHAPEIAKAFADGLTLALNGTGETDVSAPAEGAANSFSDSFTTTLTNKATEMVAPFTTVLDSIKDLSTFDFSSLLAGFTSVEEVDTTAVDNLNTAWNNILTIVKTVALTIQRLTSQTFTVNVQQNNTGGENKETSSPKPAAPTQTTTTTVAEVNIPPIDTTPVANASSSFATAADEIGKSTTTASQNIQNVSDKLAGITDKSTGVGNTAKAIDSLKDKKVSITGNISANMSARANIAVHVTGAATAQTELKASSPNISKTMTAVSGAGAKGNAAAMVKGSAFVKGQKNVLMGELGPELVVANGRYYTVGNNGAEFVDLPDDAIVFNHLQTKKLLGNKKVNGRGTPAVSEDAAVSFAHGNVDGVAMASASSALTALKQIRAMWQSMLDASARDLGSQAGRKGGGGGGGCFAAGTLIAMQNGHKNIEDILPGDMVLSYNELTGINEYSKVLQTMIHDVEEEIYTLYIEDEALVVTGIHRFFINRNGQTSWVPAAQLDIGDLVMFADGTWHEIYNIDIAINHLFVYNFEVSNNHNYYVGHCSILAHNKGGGGGGGGGGDDAEIPDPTSYLHDLDRWYDLLRQIEKWEQKINYEEEKRNNMRSGKQYSDSLKDELNYLQRQADATRDLAALQKDWYEIRRREFQASAYSNIFSYDENGLKQYTKGKNRGLDLLATINASDVNGKAKMTAQQQVEYLKANGFKISDFEYDDSGNLIKLDESKYKKKKGKARQQAQREAENDYYTALIEQFWNNIDSITEEMDSLYDSYNEKMQELEQIVSKETDIIQEYIDKHLEVEKVIYKSIEDREQAIIDALQDERDNLEKATTAYIEGLTDALDKERNKYEQNNKDTELVKLQRQLAILQRSGGSSTQIKSLQDQISSKLKDSYFDAQQNQIDSIQDASDKQLERMDTQIELMTEALEYQKENGLFWREVSEVLATGPNNIRDFIARYNTDYRGLSNLDYQEQMQELGKNVEIASESLGDLPAMLAYRDMVTGSDAVNHRVISLDDVRSAMKRNDEGGFTAGATEGVHAAIAASDTAYYGGKSKVLNEFSASNKKTKLYADEADVLHEYDQIYAEQYEQMKANGDESLGIAQMSKNAADAASNIILAKYNKALAYKDLKKIPTTVTPTKNFSQQYIGAKKKNQKTSFKKGSNYTLVGYEGDNFKIQTGSGKKAKYYLIPASNFDNGEQTLANWKFNDAQVSINEKALQDYQEVLKKYNYAYKEGGVVDYTGPAWVDGTKKKPESFLNAAETKFVKEQIFGKANNSLLSIVTGLQEVMNNRPTSVTNASDNISIGNIEITLQTGVISNDYSAQRAGDTIAQEILRIARKTGANTISRR